ncbi:MAG: aldo/keto reductase [Acidimicrobiales bacterium]
MPTAQRSSTTSRSWRALPRCSRSAKSTTWPASTGPARNGPPHGEVHRPEHAQRRRRARGATKLDAVLRGGGRPDPALLERIDAVRAVLTSRGRTLAQGALAYLWARSDKTIPIPCCRTVAQVEENAAAMAYGPLSADELSEVERLLGRPERHPVASAPAPD